jgi:hypothetical protein
MSTGTEAMGRLPFCRETVLVPRKHRGSALAGMALSAPTRPAVVRLHRVVARGMAAVGPWWLPPVRQVGWPEWIGADGAATLLQDLRGSLGRFDALALHVPRQPARRSLALLLLDGGRPRAFVKVKPDPAPVDLEAAVMTALAGPDPGPIEVAQPVARGSCGVHWLAARPLGGPHVPRLEEPGSDYETWLDERLEPVLDRGTSPPHWRPAHGDLAPWNLRTRGTATWLFDWESASYAPPGADRTYFRAARAVVLKRRPGDGPPEAVDYWRGKVAARGRIDGLNRRLLEALSQMGTRCPGD